MPSILAHFASGLASVLPSVNVESSITMQQQSSGGRIYNAKLLEDKLYRQLNNAGIHRRAADDTERG